MKKITILAPAYNEALNLPVMVQKLDEFIEGYQSFTGDKMTFPSKETYEWEYLFVNDGSQDNTLDVLRKLREENSRVNYVNLSRNFGKENALLAGMDFATGNAIIIMDADLQHPLSAIPEMIHWWENGYDDVYGLRKTRGRETWLRKKLSLTFYSLLQNTTRIEILQNVGDFRLLDRRVVDSIRALRETQRYTKGLYCWVGYNKKEVTFEQLDRMEGESSFNFKSLFNLAIEGITCFTTSPLRISSILGFITSLAALLYLIFVVFKTIVFGEAIQGFPTLLTVILFMGGLQLIALGIIGEYIARIFNETKKRPPYISESYNGDKIR